MGYIYILLVSNCGVFFGGCCGQFVTMINHQSWEAIFRVTDDLYNNNTINKTTVRNRTIHDITIHTQQYVT